MSTESQRQIGEYSIIARLGRGGMGEVYLARRSGQGGFERLFAIKVLLEDRVDEPEAILMFHDEANIASRIHHPNVVSTVDIGSEEDVHYLVMEYVEGCSLFELLRKNRKFRPPQLIVSIMLDALRGLHAAHELSHKDGRPLNLIHRDFSPHNLLIGVDGSCRVTDFGVAKVSVRMTQTRQGVNKGKLSYMSPEQLSAVRDIDRRVDIWAAGVVFWSALTGSMLFRGESEAVTIANILRHDAPPPSTVGLNPPECFDTICLKAISRRRDDRYSTALEMAEELHAVALRHGHLATPTQVSQWIQETFAHELEIRRKAIRLATCNSSDRLPVLPRAELTPTPFPNTADKTDECEFEIEVTEATVVEASEGSIEKISSQVRMFAEPSTPQSSEESLLEQSVEPSQSNVQVEPHKAPSSLVFRMRYWGIGVVLTLVLSASVVGVYYAILESESHASIVVELPEKQQEKVVENEPVKHSVPPLEANSVGGDADSTPELIELTLRGLPEKATVSVNGQETPGQPLRLSRQDGEQLIEVEAEGYEPWSMRLLPETDTIIYVDLDRRLSISRDKRSTNRSRNKRPTSRGRLVRNPGF